LTFLAIMTLTMTYDLDMQCIQRIEFLGQGFQNLQPKQDKQTDTDRRGWMHYHAAFVGG